MKDAKGHGSDSRGGQFPDHAARIRADSEKNPLKGYFLGGGTPASDQAAREILSSGGPKSDPAPVHDAMQTPGHSTDPHAFDNDYPSHSMYKQANKQLDRSNPNYHAGAVQNAINSSNRSGRRIGGKEAAAIHRLLSRR
jgi:hypothetical protein